MINLMTNTSYGEMKQFIKKNWKKLNSIDLKFFLKEERNGRCRKMEITLLERALRKKNKEEKEPIQKEEGPQQGKCTQCLNDSNRLITQSAKNVDGVMIQLLKPGEKLCPCCASLRGHESLGDIHNGLMMEVSHG